MNIIGKRILNFGNKFKGRLDDVYLNGALEYISYNEENLAFDVLCTHLYDYAIPISIEELTEAIHIALEINMNIDDSSVSCLKSLVNEN